MVESINMGNELKIKKKRIRTGNWSYKKYEKTKNGFLMRTYRNMKSRILGIQKLKAHLYLGKELLAKEEFYKFSLQSVDFHSLFEVWENSNYNRKLTPSIDRINSDLGYSLDNIRWITHSENSGLGNKKKRLKINQFSSDNDFIKQWDSIKEAECIYGRGVGRSCRKGGKTKGYLWRFAE